MSESSAENDSAVRCDRSFLTCSFLCILEGTARDALMHIRTLTATRQCYQVLRSGEIDQPHVVGRNCGVEAKLSDSGTKYTFLPDVRIEIADDNLDVIGRAFVVQIL